MHGLFFFLLSCAFGLSCVVLSVTHMSRSVSECEKTHIHTSAQAFSVHVQTPVRSTLTSKKQKKSTNLLLFVYKCTYIYIFIYLYLHNLLVVMLIIHRFLFALFSIHNAVLIFFFVVSLSSTFSTLYFCFFFFLSIR